MAIICYKQESLMILIKRKLNALKGLKKMGKINQNKINMKKLIVKNILLGEKKKWV